MTERSCRYGLSHLIAVGYAWSPQRGRWRLTDAGRAIALTLPSLPAIDRSDAPARTLPVEAGIATAEESAELAPTQEDPSGAPTSLWLMLAGIAAAVVLALARRSATSTQPAPPPAPPTIWPYDGWRI